MRFPLLYSVLTDAWRLAVIISSHLLKTFNHTRQIINPRTFSWTSRFTERPDHGTFISSLDLLTLGY